MALIEHYLALKQTHVALVAASGSLFAARGLAVLAGQGWAMARPARLASVGIDTLLLTAGAALWALLGLHPVRDAWLGTKLLLLVAYVVLGSLALKRAATRRGRLLAFAAAVAVFLFMVGVARAHAPLGLLAALAASGAHA